MPVARSRAARGGTPAIPLAVALSGLLLVGMAAAPAPVGAAVQAMVPACAGVNLRTGTSTSAAIKVRLSTAAKVTVAATVAGSSWRAVCAGAKSGGTWYRISHVNGKTVRSLYGVASIFAASGLLKRAAAAPPAPPPTDPAAATADTLGAELMRLVNLDRAALGRPALMVDPGLAAIARDAPFTCPTDPGLVLRGRAADMAARSYFGHYVLGCLRAGTTTPYAPLEIVRSVFGYTLARSEILHWNMLGTSPLAYELGCDIGGGSCAGGTTRAPRNVATAQRSFMSSTVHRTSELAAYQRFGCGSATVLGTTRTYFACLFADNGPAPAPSPSPTPTPTPTPAVDPQPPSPQPTPAPVVMAPACDGVNLRTAASTSASIGTRLSIGATVTVDATVDGSAWSTDCAGWKSGSTWYRISHVNGTAVGALYGVAALYAATGLLGPVPAAATPPPSIGAPTPLGESVTFFGRGWGHGVGLSQYGARGRALAGQGAAEILAHYYPGTTIGSLPEGAAIRVLLLDNHAPSAASPLTVYGRGDAWTIDGVDAVFPADARLRLIPATTGPITSWRAVVDTAAGSVLYDAPAPADFRVRGATAATTLQLPARSATYGTYRGTLRILFSGARADVVNELALESYLRGVVPAEMPSSWPVAARTAQTIAARSYAAARLQPGVSTFDVYDDTRSQVYRGVRIETTTADAVIADTANQVLRSGTAVASALFHSTGGGATENNENVYVSATGAKVATPVSYLRGSPDRDANGVPYDAASPYATWQTRAYTPAQLSAIFAADGRTDVGTLTALDLRDRGVSGRLVSVTLVGSSGAKTVSGGVFYSVFNAHRPAGDPAVRSTLLDVAPIP